MMMAKAAKAVKEAESRGVRSVMVVYDVPQGSKIGNPSSVFRSRGVRVNLSCWIVPETRVPWEYLKRMDEAGCRTETVRFDEHEQDRIRELAKRLLREEAARIQASLGKAILKVDEMLAEAPVDSPVWDKAVGNGRAAFRHASKHLKMAQEAALAFDLTGDLSDLWDAMGHAVESLQKGWSVRVRVRENSKHAPLPIDVVAAC